MCKAGEKAAVDGKIINGKHEDSRIILNEDCPKYIVELFTMQVTQKRTPEVTIRK